MLRNNVRETIEKTYFSYNLVLSHFFFVSFFAVFLEMQTNHIEEPTLLGKVTEMFLNYSFVHSLQVTFVHSL